MEYYTLRPGEASSISLRLDFDVIRDAARGVNEPLAPNPLEDYPTVQELHASAGLKYCSGSFVSLTW